MAAEQRHTETIITDVTFEEYWEHYAEQGYEWVGEGMVKMPAVYRRHDQLRRYIEDVLSIYLDITGAGVVQADPFAMRFMIDDIRRVRLPDLQVILNPTPERLTEEGTLGPADIAVEITSAKTAGNDYGDKFLEYEAIGVQEYWIIDPQRQRAQFNQLDAEGRYQLGDINDNGDYISPVLPGLIFHVPTLWQKPLPTTRQVVKWLESILGAD